MPGAIAQLLEQIDQAVDALGAGSHQPQALDQALDVRLIKRNALYQLAMYLELESLPCVPWSVDAA
jgi:hypothetical protein